MPNLRLALRALARTPGFSAAVIVTLALGIGANTAVFSALDAVLLRPLPFPNSDRLVTLKHHAANDVDLPLSPVRIEEWNHLNSTFDGITGLYVDNSTETTGELPERLVHAHVAPRFLQVLGIVPARGRGFSNSEETVGPSAVALISDRYWKRRFGGDPNAIGTRLRTATGTLTIIGIMPASFRFQDATIDIWTPIPSLAPQNQGRNFYWFEATGRLKSGVTLDQARVNLAQIQAALRVQFPRTDTLTPVVNSLKETSVGRSRTALWLLYGSVSLLLFIACSNIAALLLTRAIQQQREIVVRFALGATRASVAMQLLTETLLLASAGAILGIAIAASASGVFRALAKDLPRVDEIALDSGTLLYTLTCALAVTLLCGVIPSVRATRRDLRGSIASGGRALVSSRGGIQWSLVGIQIALSVTLLAGAGLMIRSFQELARVSPGFDMAHVTTFRISSSWSETGSNIAALATRTNRMLENLHTIPGVENAALTSALPGVHTPTPDEFFLVEGRADDEPKLMATRRVISAGYFETLKIPLLSGGLCSDGTDISTGMVNRAFADKFFSNRNVVGLHIRSGNPTEPPFEIRGIVADSHEDGISVVPAPTLYTCRPLAIPVASFLIRSNLSADALAESIRRKIAEVDPAKSVFEIVPLETRVSETSALERMITVLLSVFAVTAIGLACLGLYGTLSYFASLQRREVGLRLALGAARSQIVSRFVRKGLIVSALGCFAGIVLAAATSRILTSVLFGVSSSDALTLSSVVALVLSVATAASLLPSLRAARVEPMQVLRSE